MPKPSREEWSRWFAWYPVMASVGEKGTALGFVPDSPYLWVWLEHVERKRIVGDGSSWIYRTPAKDRAEKYYGIVWPTDTTI